MPTTIPPVLQHPNGFTRVVISEGADGSAERVHIWPVAGVRDGDIHQHHYSQGSCILSGVMAEHIYGYEHDPAGEWLLWDVICGTRSDGEYRVAYGTSTRVRPVLLRTEIHKVGETYCRDAETFHLIEVIEAPLITRNVKGVSYRDRHYLMRELR